VTSFEQGYLLSYKEAFGNLETTSQRQYPGRQAPNPEEVAEEQPASTQEQYNQERQMMFAGQPGQIPPDLLTNSPVTSKSKGLSSLSGGRTSNLAQLGSAIGMDINGMRPKMTGVNV
jgi:hypothetical protein